MLSRAFRKIFLIKNLGFQHCLHKHFSDLMQLQYWVSHSLCTSLQWGNSPINNNTKGEQWIILAKYEEITDSYSDKGSTKYSRSPSELCISYGKGGAWGRKNQTEELGETPLPALSLIQFFIEWNKSSFSPQATVGYFGQTFP